MGGYGVMGGVTGVTGFQMVLNGSGGSSLWIHLDPFGPAGSALQVRRGDHRPLRLAKYCKTAAPKNMKTLGV